MEHYLLHGEGNGRTVGNMQHALLVCEQMKGGPVTVGSVCTGWGVGDMVVDAVNEYLQDHCAHHPESEDDAHQTPIPKAGQIFMIIFLCGSLA